MSWTFSCRCNALKSNYSSIGQRIFYQPPTQNIFTSFIASSDLQFHGAQLAVEFQTSRNIQMSKVCAHNPQNNVAKTYKYYRKKSEMYLEVIKLFVVLWVWKSKRIGNIVLERMWWILRTSIVLWPDPFTTTTFIQVYHPPYWQQYRNPLRNISLKHPQVLNIFEEGSQQGHSC